MRTRFLMPLLWLFASSLGCASTVKQYHAKYRGMTRIAGPVGTRKAFEPSGLVRVDDRWFTVSDKLWAIYELKPANGELHAEEWLSVYESSKSSSQFESICAYQDGFLVAQEDPPTLIEITSTRAVVAHVLEDNGLLHRGEGGDNAGLEGVAVGQDALGRLRVFAAKERSPRLLLEIDPRSWEVVRALPLPLMGYPRGCVDADIADLQICDGFVYALFRNDASIMKMSMDGRLLAQAHYPSIDRELYATDEPFGLFEGMWIDAESIWLVVDNNQFARRAAPEDLSSTVVQFSRPVGF